MADKLRAWQKRNRLKDAEAAAIVRLSVSAWRRQRDDLTQRKEQTMELCECYELKRLLDPLQLAALTELVNKLFRLSVSRRH